MTLAMRLAFSLSGASINSSDGRRDSVFLIAGAFLQANATSIAKGLQYPLHGCTR